MWSTQAIEQRDSGPLPNLETVRGRFARCWLRLAIDSLPLGLVERRKEGIAIRVGIDTGEVKTLSQTQTLCVQLRPADKHQLGGTLFVRPLLRAAQGIVQTGKGFRAFELQIRLTTNYQIQATG